MSEARQLFKTNGAGFLREFIYQPHQKARYTLSGILLIITGLLSVGHFDFEVCCASMKVNFHLLFPQTCLILGFIFIGAEVIIKLATQVVIPVLTLVLTRQPVPVVQESPQGDLLMNPPGTAPGSVLPVPEPGAEIPPVVKT